MTWEPTGNLRWKKMADKPLSRSDLVFQERWADFEWGCYVCPSTGMTLDIAMRVEKASEWRDVTNTTPASIIIDSSQ